MQRPIDGCLPILLGHAFLAGASELLVKPCSDGTPSVISSAAVLVLATFLEQLMCTLFRGMPYVIHVHIQPNVEVAHFGEPMLFGNFDPGTTSSGWPPQKRPTTSTTNETTTCHSCHLEPGGMKASRSIRAEGKLRSHGIEVDGTWGLSQGFFGSCFFQR